MNRRITLFLSIAAVLAALPIAADDQSASPAGNLRSLHSFYFRDIVAAAEQVDPEDYGFRAADGVRTYGELIGHISAASFGLCSMARGEDPPTERAGIEKRAAELGKPGLIGELTAARDYCDQTFADLKGPDAVSERGTTALSKALFDGKPVSTAGVLIFHVSHITNHFGNLVTYLRLLGEVPPSTARAQSAGS